MDTLTLFPIDKFMGASRLIFRNSTLIVYLDDEIEKFTEGKFDFFESLEYLLVHPLHLTFLRFAFNFRLFPG